jgi:hypothetical protein
MTSLLYSANFVGYLGLALIIAVGCKTAFAGKTGGWLLAAGAVFFLFSRLFRFYAEPALVGPIHLEFTRGQITFVTALPTVTLALGFVLIPLGLLLLGLADKKAAGYSFEK